MIPHYQDRTLNYDNRINAQINRSLKKKYANLATINFASKNAETEQAFTDLEKVLFLIYALLQELQTYIFEAPNHATDRYDNKYYMEGESLFGGAFPDDSGESSVAPSSEYSSESDYSSVFDNFSEIDSREKNFSPFREQTRTEAPATLGIFRATLSKIFQQSLPLTRLVKTITPLFNFLSQPQIDSLKELIKNIYDLFYRTLGDVNDLEEFEVKGKDELVSVLRKIRESIITRNLIVLDKLVRSYNPIVTQGQINSVNDDGTGGYTITMGIDEGAYV